MYYNVMVVVRVHVDLFGLLFIQFLTYCSHFPLYKRLVDQELQEDGHTMYWCQHRQAWGRQSPQSTKEDRGYHGDGRGYDPQRPPHIALYTHASSYLLLQWVYVR